MSRLMIIGASFLQLPGILKAKELGHTVAVVDFNPNAIGIPFADKYYNVSTIDSKGVVDAARDFNAEGIMTLATDMPMRSVAVVAEAMNLIGISFQTAVNATDKGEMIKQFKRHGVESPWYYLINNDEDYSIVKDQLSFPCIVKPTDNAGSRGVMLVKGLSELEDAIKYSRSEGRSGAVIVEEYMTGSEVSVEVMAYKGNVNILAVTDKLTTGAPHFVELGHSQPSRLPIEEIEKIKDLAKRAVKAIGITDGPAHVEIMLTSDGPKMIELGARMGGDCITSHLVPMSTGIDMIKATIDIALGKEPDLRQKFSRGSAIKFITPETGVITKISGVDEAKAISGVKAVYVPVNLNDEVHEVASSLDRSGYIIAQADTAGEAMNICNTASKLIDIEVS